MIFSKETLQIFDLLLISFSEKKQKLKKQAVRLRAKGETKKKKFWTHFRFTYFFWHPYQLSLKVRQQPVGSVQLSGPLSRKTFEDESEMLRFLFPVDFAVMFWNSFLDIPSWDPSVKCSLDTLSWNIWSVWFKNILFRLNILFCYCTSNNQSSYEEELH